jgi:hypothetical protein
VKFSEAFQNKVQHLPEALKNFAERDEAVATIRSLIHHIIIAPDIPHKRGKIDVTLYGDMAALLEQTTRKDEPATHQGLPASVESSPRIHRNRHSFAIQI